MPILESYFIATNISPGYAALKNITAMQRFYLCPFPELPWNAS
jgi:hypothetical protein